MVLMLGLIRDKPRRFNALRRDIEGVTQKMLCSDALLRRSASTDDIRRPAPPAAILSR
jgi:DNA-binding HxlR family transcriptional regulator